MEEFIINTEKQGKRKSNKNSLVYEKIKHMILDNQLKPGTFISENALAEELGVSRTPVREAVVILAKEGFLEIYNGVGIYVQHITLKDLYDLNKVRHTLEVCALETGMHNVSYEEWESLKQQWQSLADDYLSKNQEQRTKAYCSSFTEKITHLDQKTHAFSVKSANNKFLTEIYDNVHIKVARFQKLIIRATKADYNTILQHIDILNAIQAKDIQTVSKLLKQHIFGSIDTILSNMQDDKQIFFNDSYEEQLPLY